MIHVKSGDAEIAYEILGTGPPVVLLHPFPVHHEFWLPAAQAADIPLSADPPRPARSRRLRCGRRSRHHGKACDRSRSHPRPRRGWTRPPSPEFLSAATRYSSSGGAIGDGSQPWRCSIPKRRRILPTPGPARLQAAADVLERGTEPFFESMIPKLLGKTTQREPSRSRAGRSADDAQDVARKMSLKYSEAWRSVRIPCPT